MPGKAGWAQARSSRPHRYTRRVEERLKKRTLACAEGGGLGFIDQTEGEGAAVGRAQDHSALDEASIPERLEWWGAALVAVSMLAVVLDYAVG